MQKVVSKIYLVMLKCEMAPIENNYDVLHFVSFCSISGLNTGVTLLDCPAPSFLAYCSLRSAIPKIWKFILKGFDLEDEIDYEYDLDRIIKSKDKPSRHIYWQLLERVHPVNTALKKIWETDLSITLSDENWWKLYPEFISMVKSSKLQLFQYRILNKALTTNVKRSRWDSSISAVCSICGKEEETVNHLLFHCYIVRKMWSAWERMIQCYFDITINLNLPMILLNNYKGTHQYIVNLSICVMKQYIYASKCKDNIPSFMGFMSKMSLIYLCEKDAAFKNNKLKQFYKNWKNLF